MITALPPELFLFWGVFVVCLLFLLAAHEEAEDLKLPPRVEEPPWRRRYLPGDRDYQKERRNRHGD